MWWARRRGAAMLVVLRADSLDALWPAPAQGAGVPSRMPGAQAAPGARWHAQPCAVVVAETGSAAAAGGAVDAPVVPAASALRDAVVAAFAGLKSNLASAAREGRLPALPQLVVLLGGPAAGVVTLPWSDALLQPESAQRHARAELLARGCAVQLEDSLCIDTRPGRGQPRAVFWVPAWLQREVQALASALKVRSCTLQALNLVAAAWLARQPHEGRVWGLLGSGGMQLWSATEASAAGEVLADTPAAGPLGARALALWQRARLRSPLLAAAKLRVLSLDEPPPSQPGAPAASSPGGTLDWLPWPSQAGASGRAALDLQLLRAAQTQPVLPLTVLPPPSRMGFGAGGRPLLWAATLGLLVTGLALGWAALQTEAAVQAAGAAPAEVAPPRAVATTAAERAELRAVNAAVQQLNLPLPQLLRVLQPPRDIAVRLHALDLAPRGPEAGAGPAVDSSARALVKLSAEAPRSRDMTRYVDFLAGRPGMGAVQLVRHEVDASAAGGDVYRFELELEWPR